jgi:hypothetical protein
MRTMRLSLLVLFTLVLGSVAHAEKPRLRNDARDAAASLGGVIAHAQVAYKDQCNADHLEHGGKLTNTKCLLINKAVYAQYSLFTALESYCGWFGPKDIVRASCAPNKAAEGDLKNAISNANRVTDEILK